MKVLIVNKFLYPNGGSETYIFKVGGQLQKMGHEVQYFGMEHEGRIVGNHVQSYTSDMDFHGSKLRKILYPFKIIYSIEARKQIRKVLDDFQPDAVHLNNINFQITPSVIDEIVAEMVNHVEDVGGQRNHPCGKGKDDAEPRLHPGELVQGILCGGLDQNLRPADGKPERCERQYDGHKDAEREAEDADDAACGEGQAGRRFHIDLRYFDYR